MIEELKQVLVVTSIASPNPVLRQLAEGCRQRQISFYLMGDVTSPAEFALDGCDFYSLERQSKTGFHLTPLLPVRHYARKNIGYLLAAQAGAQVLLETDDDNSPELGFWAKRERHQTVPRLLSADWVNVYRYFSDLNIWPRGLPLDAVARIPPEFEGIAAERADCPIQQGLADDDPDVDAIYRMILPLPVSFRADRRVGLGRGTWCPFNSQNTTWFREAFPLLYLPSFCSFRMTDIWRGLVAQRVAWECGWSVLFHEATVRQERNEHDLMRDFKDEVPGYLLNGKIARTLSDLPLKSGVANLAENLLACYEALVEASIMEKRELPLVEAWLEDCKVHA